jgi:hypothetical protein
MGRGEMAGSCKLCLGMDAKSIVSSDIAVRCTAIIFTALQRHRIKLKMRTSGANIVAVNVHHHLQDGR